MTATDPTAAPETFESILAACGVTCTIKLTTIGAVEHKGAKSWEHDVWHIELSGSRGSETFEYRTGSGCRRRGSRTNRPHGFKGRDFVVLHGFCYHLTQPTARELLSALASDARAFEQTFEDWAFDLGMDADSRRAKQTYDACVTTAQQLARVFGFDGFRRLLACPEEV